jgi:hypothetical protein
MRSNQIVFIMTTQLRAARRRVLHRPLLVPIAMIGLLSACSSGGSDAAPTTSPVTTVVEVTTTAPAPTTTVAVPVQLTVTPKLGAAKVTSYLGTFDLTDVAVTDAVTKAVATYVSGATLAPLGGKPASLDGLLTDTAAKSLTADTTAALSDDGIAPVTADGATTLAVDLSGLLGPDGAIGVVVATVDLTAGGTTAGGAKVSVHRTGDLTLVNQPGADGSPAWKIDAFQLNVERELP